MYRGPSTASQSGFSGWSRPGLASEPLSSGMWPSLKAAGPRPGGFDQRQVTPLLHYRTDSAPVGFPRQQHQSRFVAGRRQQRSCLNPSSHRKPEETDELRHKLLAIFPDKVAQIDLTLTKCPRETDLDNLSNIVLELPDSDEQL